MLSAPEVSAGFEYFGSFSVVVCLGPVKRLLAIRNGETDIFTGPIDSSSADSDGKTTVTTTIGTLDFYWGTASQNANALLSSLEIDLGGGAEVVPMPAYRHCCYAVLHDASFGNQVTPPTLKFAIETESSALAISAHTIDGDAVIPEAVYEYLTNALYGQGLGAGDVDSASFIIAAEQIIDEALGASPDLDSAEPARDTLGRMLSHVDGFLFFDKGKIRLKLIRKESTAGIPELDESDLLDEPSPTNKLFSETWNVTRVSYRDRDNKWEDTVESYSDPSNAAIVGQDIAKEFSFPYITKRSAAKQLAKLIGIRGGVPPVHWSLSLKPEWRTLIPGQLIKLNYDRLGITDRVCRVMEIRRGSPGKPSVQIECIEEATRDTSHDYTPPEDQFSVPGTLDSEGGGEFALTSTVPRLSWLPPGIKGDAEDGFMVALNRPDNTTSKASIWWTWDPDAFAYQKLGEIRTFPAKCQLVAWWEVRTGHWLLRVKPDTSDDYSRLQDLINNAPDLYCAVGRRTYRAVGTAINRHEVSALWLSKVAGGRFDLISEEIIDIEMQGDAFDSDDLDPDSTDPGTVPTLHCYFGRRSDFYTFTSGAVSFERDQGNAIDDDTDLKRYIKTPVSNWKNDQSTADVTAATFDRDDSTMSPDGTYSQEWGARAPSGAELFDTQGGLRAQQQIASEYPYVEDLDEALSAILAGTATAYQTLLAEHIDNTLGAMTESSQTYYKEP